MQHLYSLLYFAWCFFLSPPFIVFDVVVVVVVVDIDVIYFCCVFLFVFICWSFYQQILVGGSISVSSFLNETDSKRTDMMIYWQQPISECSYILLSISQTDRWIDRQTDRTCPCPSCPWGDYDDSTIQHYWEITTTIPPTTK